MVWKDSSFMGVMIVYQVWSVVKVQGKRKGKQMEERILRKIYHGTGQRQSGPVKCLWHLAVIFTVYPVDHITPVEAVH